VTELERFFRRIVSNLAATDPGRLRSPVPLGEIPTSIVPYRSNRRALEVETSEEYEMVLLRLCAGEGGFIRTEPEEVRLKFEEEAQSTNPDLEVIHRFEDVSLMLRPERVARALQAAADEPEARSYAEAPRQVEPQPEADDAEGEEPEQTDDEEDIEAVDEVPELDEYIPAAEPSGSQCVYCGGTLPDRPLNFCPHCGQSQVALVCPKCHADVEAGWRHCVNCGLALGGR
jgi:hypothetical protein